MLSGWSSAVLNFSGGTSVTLNNCVPGQSSYSNEKISSEDIDGKINGIYDSAQLIIAAYDEQHYTTLRSMMINKTNITSVTVYGTEENIYWTSATTIIVKKRIPVKTGTRSYLIIKLAQIGNDLSSNIYTGVS